jgi:hypothetical protein
VVESVERSFDSGWMQLGHAARRRHFRSVQGMNDAGPEMLNMHFLCQIANSAYQSGIRIETGFTRIKVGPAHFYMGLVAVFTWSRISYSHKLRQPKRKRSDLALNTNKFAHCALRLHANGLGTSFA